MKVFGIFFNFLIFFAFALYFKMILNRTGKNKKKEDNDYIQKEHDSIFSRRREIDSDLFIKPDINKFPIVKYSDNLSDHLITVYEKQCVVINKSENKMLYLKDTSNLELKQRFGYANLEAISDYEKNFQSFIFAVFDWAVALKKAGLVNDAICALEALVDFGSNYSKSFILLADLYFEKKEKHKLNDLVKKLSLLDETMQKRVVNHINKHLD